MGSIFYCRTTVTTEWVLIQTHYTQMTTDLGMACQDAND